MSSCDSNVITMSEQLNPGDSMTSAGVTVELYARAELPTAFGEFTTYVFRSNLDNNETVAMLRGNPNGARKFPVRLHSECLTGDVFASHRCDCRAQLELAMKQFGRQEDGLLVYLRQEGRGIGLGNKIRAYALQQNEGLDTVEANLHLGFDDDLRDYRVSAMILKMFGVESVQLATNNPLKIQGLRDGGVDVEHRMPVLTSVTEHNVHYLQTKAEKSGHLLPSNYLHSDKARRG